MAGRGAGGGARGGGRAPAASADRNDQRRAAATDAEHQGRLVLGGGTQLLDGPDVLAVDAGDDVVRPQLRLARRGAGLDRPDEYAAARGIGEVGALEGVVAAAARAAVLAAGGAVLHERREVP